MMATSNNKTVPVLQKINRHSSDVMSCDFLNEHYLATGSGDKTVMVWEWKPGLGFVEAACSLLLGHKYSVTCVRFSPKGCLLVSSSADGYSLLWDIKTGQCIHSFVQSNGNGVRTCCFSTDGALLATAGEGGILCLWEISSHNLIGTIDGHDEESIQGTSFTPDNMLIVSGDVMGTYRIWQVTSANNNDCSALTAVREAHDLGINALEFSSQYNSFTDIQGIIERSYLLVSCGNDHCVVLWQVSMRQQDKPQNTFVVHTPVALMTLQGHTSAVLSARFSPKGDMLASTSIDKTARIWEVSTGKCVKTLEGHDRYITCCAFSSNQSLLVTGSNDKSIWVWNLSSDFSVDTELGESSNGQRTSNGVSDGLCYESSAVKLNHKLEKHSGSINTCHFSTTHLATAGSDKLIYLWKWDATGVHLDNILEGHRYAINQVEFSPCGSLASCSYDGTTLIWDPLTGEIVRSGFHISASGVRCVRFSPDWKLLATGGDDERASLFNVDSCELIASLTGHTEAVTCIAFSPDSYHLLTGCGDGHCRIYCTSPCSQSPYYTLEDAHDLGVASSDFSPILHTQPNGIPGRYEVATCGHDCLVKVWSVDAIDKTITLVWRLTGHGGSVTCVRYSPQLAELIASTATDKTCRLWDPYSGVCLHILSNHEGILTCCAFSPDSTFLATGSMDKTVMIWDLPKDIGFQSFVDSQVKTKKNVVACWTTEDVNRWLEKNNLPPANINGSVLLDSPSDLILDQLNIGDLPTRNEMRAKLAALRRIDSNLDTPYELLCPITHHIMRDPVKCADGYTYERSAIESWFRRGHCTSPMTNIDLTTTHVEQNIRLQATIGAYLTALSQAK